MKQLLENYTGYNHWANENVCNFISSNEQLLDMEIKSSFNTIRKTLYHIRDAETIWYKRLNGESPNKWPNEKFTGSIKEFIRQFLANSLLLNDYVKSKSYPELLEYIDYTNMSSKKCKDMIANCILHCVNHSTHHRGQIYTMLRQAGITNLTSIDYITFIRKFVEQ